MSSQVVYNSMGVIDEGTLNEFAMVINIGNSRGILEGI